MGIPMQIEKQTKIYLSFHQSTHTSMHLSILPSIHPCIPIFLSINLYTFLFTVYLQMFSLVRNLRPVSLSIYLIHYRLGEDSLCTKNCTKGRIIGENRLILIITSTWIQLCSKIDLKFFFIILLIVGTQENSLVLSGQI